MHSGLNAPLLTTFCNIGCYTYLMKYPELSLHRWAKQYGPIVSFVIGNQRFIVLSDPHVVKDLLITNGTIFSSRKDTFIKARTILKNRGITATGYNDLWCVIRKT